MTIGTSGVEFFRYTTITLFLLVLIDLRCCMFVHMKLGVSKCFMEDVANNTLMLVKWKAEDSIDPGFASTSESSNIKASSLKDRNIGVFLNIIDPKNVIVYKGFTNIEGKIAYQTTDQGIYHICFNTNTSSWFATTDYTLNFMIHIGSGDYEFELMSQKKRMQSLSLFIEDIDSRIKNIKKQQLYHLEKEHQMRKTSESIRNRIFYFTLIQVAIILLTTVFQNRYLKRFLVQKK